VETIVVGYEASSRGISPAGLQLFGNFERIIGTRTGYNKLNIPGSSLLACNTKWGEAVLTGFTPYCNRVNVRPAKYMDTRSWNFAELKSDKWGYNLQHKKALQQWNRRLKSVGSILPVTCR